MSSSVPKVAAWVEDPLKDMYEDSQDRLQASKERRYLEGAKEGSDYFREKINYVYEPLLQRVAEDVAKKFNLNTARIKRLAIREFNDNFIRSYTPTFLHKPSEDCYRWMYNDLHIIAELWQRKGREKNGINSTNESSGS